MCEKGCCLLGMENHIWTVAETRAGRALAHGATCWGLAFHLYVSGCSGGALEHFKEGMVSSYRVNCG